MSFEINLEKQKTIVSFTVEAGVMQYFSIDLYLKRSYCFWLFGSEMFFISSHPERPEKKLSPLSSRHYPREREVSFVFSVQVVCRLIW